MIVGLTGGIATGKSTVGQILEELGATVIDADQVARAIVEPGTECLDEIVRIFGDAILKNNGSLDRDALGAVVINDRDARLQLERITHPRIRAEIAREVQRAVLAGAPSVFVEAALLVETGSARIYEHLGVVVCSEEAQIERLKKRKGCNDSTARSWVAAQMPLAEKAKHATQIIQNNADIETLKVETEQAYRELMVQRPGQG